MNKLLYTATALTLILFSACRKNNDTQDPGQPYQVTIENHFNLLDGEYAAFISDADGTLLTYRTLPPNDTAQLVLPALASTEKLDLTLVKIVTLEAPGTGVRDTAITLSTYTALSGGQRVHLRDLEFRQATDLYLGFSNLNSLDSIIVPDGLTFVRPRPENLFQGWYRVLHTGDFWLRVRVNGEPMWRYLYFSNINAPTLTVTANVALLPIIFSHPGEVKLPFSAPWKYNVDGIMDTAAHKFLAMGDLIRAPGGITPVLDQLNVIEPVANDAFEPSGRPYSGYRLRFDGPGTTTNNYRYIHDGYYPAFPATLPNPAFEVVPPAIPLANPRFLAGTVSGTHDALILSRERAGTPSLRWDTYLPPSSATATYSLPDLPAALANRFPTLRDYKFTGPVRARAESFSPARSYAEIVNQRLFNSDPLWTAKWRYTAKEKAY